MSQVGIYEEALPCGAKLKVTKSSWQIEYYFPGPNLRYNGTFVRIQGSQVHSFISAFQENWEKYSELKKSIPKGGEFNAAGNLGMQIRVGDFNEGVCIESYHMPLKSIDSVNKVIEGYKYAMKRAPEIQKFLSSL